MPEQQLHIPNPNIPSGYESAIDLRERAVIDSSVLPWVKEPVEIGVSECVLQSGETFQMASAISTHPKLVEAANGMTDKQRRNTDNMFYSRIPEIIITGYSPNVETMDIPSTDFPIFTMRNGGGQRVYFARTRLMIGDKMSEEPVILRLAAIDKNKQDLVMSVLSGASKGTKQKKNKN
jgi:hypothetical protein